jgi:hypothetical protein
VTFVYVHWHGAVPIYVGVGSRDRAFTMGGPRARNKLWRDYIAKHGKPRVEIPYEDMTKEAAWACEQLLIDQYGRVCDGGTLLQASTGGPKSARGAPMPKSIAHRAKIGAASRGRKYSAETRALWSAQRKGKKQSPEFIAKRIAACVAAKRAKKPVHSTYSLRDA